MKFKESDICKFIDQIYTTKQTHKRTSRYLQKNNICDFYPYLNLGGPMTTSQQTIP